MPVIPPVGLCCSSASKGSQPKQEYPLKRHPPSLSHILTPLLLNPSTNAPACMPAQTAAPPMKLMTFSPSSSRRAKNSSVPIKFLDVSVVMNSSALAYIVARPARLVYQDEVTSVLPARYKISSERRASSRRAVGRCVGVANKANASCHR